MEVVDIAIEHDIFQWALSVVISYFCHDCQCILNGEEIALLHCLGSSPLRCIASIFCNLPVELTLEIANLLSPLARLMMQRVCGKFRTCLTRYCLRRMKERRGGRCDVLFQVSRDLVGGPTDPSWKAQLSLSTLQPTMEHIKFKTTERKKGSVACANSVNF
jgi:hypothetical protein